MPFELSNQSSDAPGQSIAQIAQEIWSPTPNAKAAYHESSATASPRVSSESPDANLNSLEIVENNTESGAQPSLSDLAAQARESVGSNRLGNVSPAEARDFPNFRVAPHIKCAATVSTWLVGAGFIDNKDFKIRVTDPARQGLNELLPGIGFDRSSINGKINPEDFPEGPIGIISATGKYSDGSNHIGFVEKRNGELRVMHNRSGKVADDALFGSYFYDGKGNPRFGDIAIFRPTNDTTVASR
jgi:hypothetical protein